MNRPNTIRWLIVLSLLLAGLAEAQPTDPIQTNIIYGYVGDYGQVVAAGVPVTSTLTWPNPRAVGNVLVQPDPQTHYSDASGYFAFTNQAWGIYELTMPYYKQVYYVFTNTAGSVPVANLFTNSVPFLTNTPIVVNVTLDYNQLSNCPPTITLTNWNGITLSNGITTLIGNRTNTVVWIGYATTYPTNWGVVSKPGWTNSTGYTCFVSLTNQTFTAWFDQAGVKYSGTNANMPSGVVMPGGWFTNVAGGGQFHAFK